MPLTKPDNQDIRANLGNFIQSSNAYRLFFDEAPVNMLVTDPTGRFIAVNTQFTLLTGYPENELSAMNMVRLNPSRDGDGDLFRENNLNPRPRLTNCWRISV